MLKTSHSLFNKLGFTLRKNYRMAVSAAAKNDFKWHPFDVFHKKDDEFALILLNGSEAKTLLQRFLQLWQNAPLRAATDGAANALYELSHSGHRHCENSHAKPTGVKTFHSENTRNQISGKDTLRDEYSCEKNLRDEISRDVNLRDGISRDQIVRDEISQGRNLRDINLRDEVSDGASSLSLPSLISGDFDSASPAILEYFQTQGCEIVHTPDQNSTDFTKCLRLVTDKITVQKLKLSSIVVLCSHGGERFDHVMGNIHTMFLAREMTSLPVYLLSNYSIEFLLPEGRHFIDVGSTLLGDWCGLIPIGQPCEHVTTSGLNWNLVNQRLSFGDLVSTSNTFTSGVNTVTVETDRPLLLTMGIKSQTER